MKAILNKLILLMVILSVWIVYDQWEIFSHLFASTRDKISTQFTDTFSSNANDNAGNVTTTTVYRWKNKKGEWQFSNTKPEHVPDAEIQLFRSDTNVVPSIPSLKTPPTKGEIANNLGNTEKNEEQSGGILNSIKGKMDEVTQLKKTLETPKKIPTE